MQINAAIFWIIDAVATDKRLLDNLKENVVERAFNREGHGLTNDEPLAVLDELFSDGFLFADRVVDLQTWESKVLVPDTAELRRIFSGQDWVWYGLTEKGSAFWENMTHPRWEKYIFSELAFDGQCRVESGGQHTLEAYLSRLDVQRCITPGTLLIETAADWEATYWKTLSAGYTARFVVPADQVEEFPFAEPADDWYTHPFKASLS